MNHNNGGLHHQKMMTHEEYVEKKLNQLEALIGKSKIAGDLKGTYAKMIMNSNTELINQRESNCHNTYNV